MYTYVRQNPWTAFDPQGLDDKKKSKPKPKPKAAEKSDSVDRGAAGSDLQSDSNKPVKIPSNTPKDSPKTNESARDTKETTDATVEVKSDVANLPGGEQLDKMGKRHEWVKVIMHNTTNSSRDASIDSVTQN